MNRRNRFLIGLAAAAITFGALMATVGPQRFARYSQHCNQHERYWDNKSQERQDTPLKTQ